jgi:hypothetical protein
MRRKSFERTVVRLVAEGDRLHHGGDLAAAIGGYRQACTLVREAIEAGLDDPAGVQQLGSMLYTLGEWQLEAGDHRAAADSLGEAEAAYERLGGPAATQLITDVIVRRARVHAAARQPLSAIAEAQQAAARALARAAADPGGPGVIDAARVLAHAGSVQLRIGADPDLAVAAADWALREYLAAFGRGGMLALPAAHAPAVLAAARIAYIVHTAAGRDDLAQMAHRLATATDGGAPYDPAAMVADVRDSRPTLAAVLLAAGREDLAQDLTAPATDVRLLVPAMRRSSQVAPAYAEQLGRLGTELDGPAEVLLYLEAHALFAGASQDRVPSMRYELGHFGPHWAAATMNFGQRMAEAGETAAAVDAADWLGGIVGQLVPYTLLDAQARGTAEDAAEWQQAIYDMAGDTEAAARAGQLRQMLAAQPPG